MRRVVWTPVAESELEDILSYIAFVGRRPATADRLYREIHDSITARARDPQVGHVHPHAPEGWKYLRHKRWLIFYQSSAEGVEVMRVVDAARDLPRMLRRP